jgi:hypothetical protein
MGFLESSVFGLLVIAAAAVLVAFVVDVFLGVTVVSFFALGAGSLFFAFGFGTGSAFFFCVGLGSLLFVVDFLEDSSFFEGGI